MVEDQKLTIARIRQKPLTLEAAELRPDTLYAVAGWCATVLGKPLEAVATDDLQHFELLVPTPGGGMATARPGNWVILRPDGFEVCDPQTFIDVYNVVLTYTRDVSGAPVGGATVAYTPPPPEQTGDTDG